MSKGQRVDRAGLRARIAALPGVRPQGALPRRHDRPLRDERQVPRDHRDQRDARDDGSDGPRRPRQPHRVVREGHLEGLDQLSLGQGPVEAARHRRRGPATTSRSRRPSARSASPRASTTRATTSPISARSATCAMPPRRSSSRFATASAGEVWDDANDIFKQQESRLRFIADPGRAARSARQLQAHPDRHRGARDRAASPRRSTSSPSSSARAVCACDFGFSRTSKFERWQLRASRSSCRCRAPTRCRVAPAARAAAAGVRRPSRCRATTVRHRCRSARREVALRGVGVFDGDRLRAANEQPRGDERQRPREPRCVRPPRPLEAQRRACACRAGRRPPGSPASRGGREPLRRRCTRASAGASSRARRTSSASGPRPRRRCRRRRRASPGATRAASCRRSARVAPPRAGVREHLVLHRRVALDPLERLLVARFVVAVAGRQHAGDLHRRDEARRRQPADLVVRRSSRWSRRPACFLPRDV